MILHVESDAAYLFMLDDCSRIAGNYYLINHPTNTTNPSGVKPNGLILIKCNTLQHAVGFAE